jgi:hypothetical protein
MSTPLPIKRRASTQSDPDADVVTPGQETTTTPPPSPPLPDLSPSQVREACAAIVAQYTTRYIKKLPAYTRLIKKKTALEKQVSTLKNTIHSARADIDRIKLVRDVVSALIQGHFVVVYDSDKLCSLLEKVFTEINMNGIGGMIKVICVPIKLDVCFMLGGCKWRKVEEVGIETYSQSFTQHVVDKARLSGIFPESATFQIFAKEEDLKLVDCLEPEWDRVDIDLKEAGNGVTHTEDHDFNFAAVVLGAS